MARPNNYAESVQHKSWLLVALSVSSMFSLVRPVIRQFKPSNSNPTIQTRENSTPTLTLILNSSIQVGFNFAEFELCKFELLGLNGKG